MIDDIDFEELPDIVPDSLPESGLSPESESEQAEHPNLYREAGLKFLAYYDQVLAFILEADNPRLAAWVIAIASGRRLITGGISQVQLAEKLGCTKGNVSKCVKQVQARFGNSIHGIEPMPGQRSIDSCAKFARVRKEQLK